MFEGHYSPTGNVCENWYPQGFLGLRFENPCFEPIRRNIRLSDLLSLEGKRRVGEAKESPGESKDKEGGVVPKAGANPFTVLLEASK